MNTNSKNSRLNYENATVLNKKIFAFLPPHLKNTAETLFAAVSIAPGKITFNHAPWEEMIKDFQKKIDAGKNTGSFASRAETIIMDYRKKLNRRSRIKRIIQVK